MFHRGGGQFVPANEDDQAQASNSVATIAPPGEFVSTQLEEDCARFLEELRRRVGLTEGNRALGGT